MATDEKQQLSTGQTTGTGTELASPTLGQLAGTSAKPVTVAESNVQGAEAALLQHLSQGSHAEVVEVIRMQHSGGHTGAEADEKKTEAARTAATHTQEETTATELQQLQQQGTAATAGPSVSEHAVAARRLACVVRSRFATLSTWQMHRDTHERLVQRYSARDEAGSSVLAAGSHVEAHLGIVLNSELGHLLSEFDEAWAALEALPGGWPGHLQAEEVIELRELTPAVLWPSLFGEGAGTAPLCQSFAFDVATAECALVQLTAFQVIEVEQKYRGPHRLHRTPEATLDQYGTALLLQLMSDLGRRLALTTPYLPNGPVPRLTSRQRNAAVLPSLLLSCINTVRSSIRLPDSENMYSDQCLSLGSVWVAARISPARIPPGPPPAAQAATAQAQAQRQRGRVLSVITGRAVPPPPPPATRMQVLARVNATILVDYYLLQLEGVANALAVYPQIHERLYALDAGTGSFIDHDMTLGRAHSALRLLLRSPIFDSLAAESKEGIYYGAPVQSAAELPMPQNDDAFLTFIQHSWVRLWLLARRFDEDEFSRSGPYRFGKNQQGAPQPLVLLDILASCKKTVAPEISALYFRDPTLKRPERLSPIARAATSLRDATRTKEDQQLLDEAELHALGMKAPNLESGLTAEQLNAYKPCATAKFEQAVMGGAHVVAMRGVTYQLLIEKQIVSNTSSMADRVRLATVANPGGLFSSMSSLTMAATARQRNPTRHATGMEKLTSILRTILERATVFLESGQAPNKYAQDLATSACSDARKALKALALANDAWTLFLWKFGQLESFQPTRPQ